MRCSKNHFFGFVTSIFADRVFVTLCAPCLFLAIIKTNDIRRILATNICETFQQPRVLKDLLKLIRWCFIYWVLWWPELPSSANSFHVTHLMWFRYMRMTYSCSGAQGGSGSAESLKKYSQSTRLGNSHFWGTTPPTGFMAKNRQGVCGDYFTSWANHNMFFRFRDMAS